MNNNLNETTVGIKRTNSRYIMIRENIHAALDLYTLSLYMVFRYESDFAEENAIVKRSAKFLYEKAKISRRQFFRCLNILEDNGLVLRDSDNGLNSVSTYHVAQELDYFNTNCGVVPDVHGVVPDRHTDHYSFPLSNINITTSDNPKISCQDVVEAYHEVLPDSPKIKVVGTELTKQIKSMIKNWHKYQKEGKTFSIDSFKDYLFYIQAHYSWLVKPYTTESGKIKRNNLTNLTREKNIVRIVNGEFSAN